MRSTDIRLDYQRFVDRIRMLQRTLITAHISFQGFDDQDVETFRTQILPETRTSFARLRKDIDLTIREIGEALGCGPMFIRETQTGYLECLDRERAAYLAGKVGHGHRQGQGNDLQKTMSRKSEEEAEELTEEEVTMPLNNVELNLASVTKRLQMELGTETPAPMDYTHPDTPENETRSQTPSKTSPHRSTGSPTIGSSTAYNSSGGTKAQGSPVVAATPLPAIKIEEPPKEAEITEETKPQPLKDARKPKGAKDDSKRHTYKYGANMIKQHFEEFQEAQRDIFVKLLISADPGDEDVLRIHQPGPSISELYGGDYLRGDVEEGDLHSNFDRVWKGLGETIKSSSAKASIKPPTTSSPASEKRRDSNGETYDVDNEAGADDDEFDDDEEKQLRSLKKQKGKSGEEDEEEEEDDADSVGPTREFKTNQTLVRVYSLLFAWEYVSICPFYMIDIFTDKWYYQLLTFLSVSSRFVENLSSLHTESKLPRRRGLHFHIYENLVRAGTKPMPETEATGISEIQERREDARELSIKEALALLENRPFTPIKVSTVQTSKSPEIDGQRPFFCSCLFWLIGEYATDHSLLCFQLPVLL